MCSKYVNIHTHVTTNAVDCIEILQAQVDNKLFTHEHLHTVGVHPWKAHEYTPEQVFAYLEFALRQKNCVGVGECGVDRACPVPFDAQMAVFLAHVQFAQKASLPLVVHCVRAYSDMLSVLKKQHCSVPIIFHDFRGNEKQVEQLSVYNTYFSFGASLFYTEKVQKICNLIPVDRLFLETDDADLSIYKVYNQAAQVRKCTVAELQEQIYANLTKIKFLQ